MAIRPNTPVTNVSKDASNLPSFSDSKLDWNALREKSLAPGGFGAERASIWPRLLHVDVVPTATEPERDELGAHDDERQIRLDTDRSFVLYPVDETMDDRQRRQAELNALIVRIFRRHPGLSYFQGYHDIITVLFLTLPEEVQLPAAEKISLHRLRDSMGKTLEPLMGLLRILQQLLRLADADYAALLEEQAPLPYAALSQLLTLFAHDVPTLPLIQHVFDYLLARPPIAVVYLAAAVVLSHRDEVRMLEREGEEGMIHSVLTGIPELVDGEMNEVIPEANESLQNGAAVSSEDQDDVKDKDKVPVLDTSPPSQGEVEVEVKAEDLDTTSHFLHEVKGEVKTEDSETFPTSAPPEEIHTHIEVQDEFHGFAVETEPYPFADDSLFLFGEDSQGPRFPTTDIEDTPSPPDFGEAPVPPLLLEQPHHHHDPASIPLPPSPLPTPNSPPQPSPSPPPRRPTRSPLSLPTLLRQADNLLFLYPPSHPALRLSQTMGPASVVHTWSEDPTKLPSDQEAEAMVVKGTDVVLAWEPEPPSPSSSEGDEEEEEEGERHWYGLRRRHPRPYPPKHHDEKKNKFKRESRRKLRKRRRQVFGARAPVERRTLLAGAALVLGVAMAVSVYGMHASHPARGSGGLGGGLGVGKALGGLVGAGEKLWAAVGGGMGG